MALVLFLWAFVPIYGLSIDKQVKSQKGLSNRKPQTSWSFKEFRKQRKEREQAIARSQAPKPNNDKLQDRKPSLVLVSGIILTFHHELNEEESALILKKTKEEGLKKIKNSSFLKVWVFEWDKPKNLLIAEIICFNFPKTSSLKSCKPDYHVYPADLSSQGQSTKLFPYTYNSSNFCDLFPDHSIYWAQRQIGVDLLREELKKKSRI